jgi:hypothetical protein
MLPARMRTSAGWSDASILNLSARGLMVHANIWASEGSVVELWQGDHSIIAHIVWRQGKKAGLQAEDRIPVEEMLSISEAQLLQALGPPRAERRKRPRTHDDNRIKARILEFASVAIIAATLALGFSFWVTDALARPLATVEAALRG